MKIETLRIKNFKAFKDVEMLDIPTFCVIVGANGTGKSTLFNLFGFLKDALTTNVTTALMRQGGNRGFKEVRTRNSDGAIEIEIQFREAHKSPLITYSLQINEHNGKVIVEREILKYRRGRSSGQPWHFLDFSNGTGEAVINELDTITDIKQLKREKQSLKSPDILAVKGLAQFERFPAVVALGNLIENWHVSDFHISKARPEQESSYAEHLSREGENLSLVIQYLYQCHNKVFNQIIQKIKHRVPPVSD